MFSTHLLASNGSRYTAIRILSLGGLLALLPIETACGGASASNSGPKLPVVTPQSHTNPALTLTASPLSGPAPLTVSFVAACSTCVAYTWSFGDGGTDSVPGSNQTYTYRSAGSWSAIVAGTDKQGNGATATAIITVAQQVVGNPCGKPFFPCVNRSTESIPVPATPPNAGGPGGVNTYMVDPDFNNIVVRATDYADTILPGWTQWDGNSFVAGCAGGAFCNRANADRTLWVFEGVGGNAVMLRFDPVAFASAEALIRAAGNTIPPGLPQSVFGVYTTQPVGYRVPAGRFSWTQKNLYFATIGTQIRAYCFGVSYANGLCSDALDAVNVPTVANGRIVTLVDVAHAGPNCLPSDYKPTWVADGDQDEATDSQFSVAYSSLNEGYPSQVNGGQNSGVHEVIWSQAKGCQVLNTYTGMFTADPGWGTNGMSLTLPDRFTIHSAANQDLSGTYLALSVAKCLGVCGNGVSPMVLVLGTNTDLYLCGVGYGDCGGHASFGWNYWQNAAQNTFLGQLDVRPLPNTQGTFKRVPSGKVTGVTCHGDSHMSWIADDPANVTDFLSVSSATSESQPAKVCSDSSPLRNEINLYDPAGGSIGRAGHTFNSGYSGRFSAQFAIFEWTQVGDFAAFSSDWLETLGDENGNTGCPGGFLRFDGWKSDAPLVAGTTIAPQAGNSALFLFQVTTSGTSGAKHPKWPQTIGATVTDGSAQLVNIGSGCRGDVFITDLTSAY